MNIPPPLPQERALPRPSLAVDIPKGIARPIVAFLATAFVADLLFLYHAPGLSFGVFGAFLGALLLGSRTHLPSHPLHWCALVLLGVSSLQSARFFSLSNSIVIICLLLGLSGFSAHSKVPKAWISWLEGLLSLLKPIGSIRTFQVLIQHRNENRKTRPNRMKNLFAVYFPAVCMLVLFGWLLSSGNAVLGKWKVNFLSSFSDYLSSIQFPHIGRMLCWLAFGCIALVFVCPPAPGTFGSKLDKPWRQWGLDAGPLRLQQWIACLITLNLLFLLSNVTDVIFLWFSRELPEGITHSRYVHQGVYALIATTTLSAMLMALLTQHGAVVSQNRWVRGLAYAWMVQNFVLISGVFIRLWIYVEAYGFTPKRVYVALFLALVVMGYGLLGWAIIQDKSIKWLIASNLILLFSYFSILQFVDIPRWVTHQNIGLYHKGEVKFPTERFFKQVGSHSIPFLMSIYEHPQSPEDRSRASEQLAKQQMHYNEYLENGWQGFQLRDTMNYNQLDNR